MPANPAREALGNAAYQRRGNQVRLDAHFQQAGHRADAVVGVQRGEHQVPRLRGPHGNFGRLEIPDFTHQHDVGVVPEHGAQPGGEGQADLIAHLDLDRAFQLIFDGILESDDLPALIVGLCQRGV